jgi:hypothetical protein
MVTNSLMLEICKHLNIEFEKDFYKWHKSDCFTELVLETYKLSLVK